MLSVEPQAYVHRDKAGFYSRLIELQLSSRHSGLTGPVLARRLALVARANADDETLIPWQASLEGTRKIDRHWNVTYSSHGWHRYVGRFPPHLARALLNHFSLGSDHTVLDPFVGSGTTLVEARLLGISSVGIEICPLSYLISVVKSRLDLRPEELTDAAETVLARFHELRARPHLIQMDVMPLFPNIERWFTATVRVDLSAILQALVEGGESPARDALLVALSASMRSIGNIDVDVVRAEYRRQPRMDVRIDRLITRKVARMAEDLRVFQSLQIPPARATVHLGDARQAAGLVGDADFILTSPPYGIESISYLRTHMLSYRVLHHFLKSDPWSIGDSVIGSEYLQKGLRHSLAELESPTAVRFFKQLRNERGDSLSRVQQSAAYFRDMQTVIGTWRQVLRRGMGGVVMIGNKKLLSRTIPTNVILAELLGANGFLVEPLLEQKLICNNTNARTPWSERAISEEHIIAFHC